MREIDLARLHAARQSALPICGHIVTLSRPTPWDVAQVQNNGARLDIEWAASFVVGWDFQEIDLLPGGFPEPVAFSAPAFLAWLKDNPDSWSVLIEGVTGSYRRYEEAMAERGNV